MKLKLSVDLTGSDKKQATVNWPLALVIVFALGAAMFVPFLVLHYQSLAEKKASGQPSMQIDVEAQGRIHMKNYPVDGHSVGTLSPKRMLLPKGK